MNSNTQSTTTPAKRLQCKDIPDAPILQFISDRGPRATTFPGSEYSLTNAMPAGVNFNLTVAKMSSMIKRGVVDGCDCGCPGGFELTEKGKALVEAAQ